MLIWLPIPFWLVTVVLLIRAQERSPRDIRQTWVWKPLSTLLVIAVAGLSLTVPTHDATYTAILLVGLTLSLAGDILLIPPDNARAFKAGVAAFLLAHVAYIAACVYLQTSLSVPLDPAVEIIVAVVLLAIAVVVYRSIRPGLGSLRGPVVAYMVVISAMVQRALSLAVESTDITPQLILIALGALLFYISDAILAINRFRFGDRLPRGRLLNLSAYYLGQLLIALSASFYG